MTQAHIFYSGTVQGVGFRYTVQMFATKQGLNGWVRNLRDGRVEIIVEGEKEDIIALMKAIESRFEGFIREKLVNYNPPTGEYEEFSVRFA